MAGCWPYTLIGLGEWQLKVHWVGSPLILSLSVSAVMTGNAMSLRMAAANLIGDASSVDYIQKSSSFIRYVASGYCATTATPPVVDLTFDLVADTTLEIYMFGVSTGQEIIRFSSEVLLVSTCMDRLMELITV